MYYPIFFFLKTIFEKYLKYYSSLDEILKQQFIYYVYQFRYVAFINLHPLSHTTYILNWAYPISSTRTKEKNFIYCTKSN